MHFHTANQPGNDKTLSILDIYESFSELKSVSSCDVNYVKESAGFLNNLGLFMLTQFHPHSIALLHNKITGLFSQ